MRALRIILVTGVLLFLAAVFGAAYVFFIRPATLPIYHMDQHPSTQRANFAATTLDFGSMRFISDASEFPLEMKASTGILSMIGRTQDGMNVYAIPGLDPKRYVMLTTEMFPSMIFRSDALPPVRPGATRFDAVRLLANPSGKPGAGINVTTRDAAIISELTDRLTRREGAAQKGTPTRSAILHLLSGDLPGIGYLVYAYAAPGGQVFLAEKHAPEDWIPAGPALTAWACGTSPDMCLP